MCPVPVEQIDACPVDGRRDVGSAVPAPLPRVRLGNPISLVTGTKRQVETDLDLGDAPLGFRRSYASDGAHADIGLGQGWRHSYAVTLYATETGGREIVESSGRHVRFAPSVTGPDGAEVWPAELGTDGRLVADDGGGHRWHLPDGRTLVFHGRWLVRIDWPGHRFLRLGYSLQGLVAVVDETGRRLRLEYVPGTVGLTIWEGGDAQLPPGHLSAIVLPDGRRIRYAYDGRRNLTRATYPDDTVRRYHYEDEHWSNHLTGLTDRTGERFATWAYDETGRAVLSERSGGVERASLRIDDPEAPDGIGTTTVTDSVGRQSVYTWRRGVPSGTSLLLTADGPGCASCPQTGRRYRYDAEGRLVEASELADDGTVASVLELEHDRWGRTLRVTENHVGVDGQRVERLVERREYLPPGPEGGVDFRPVRIARPSVDPNAEHVVEIVRASSGLIKSVRETGRSPSFGSDGAPIGFETVERVLRIEHDDLDRPVALDGPRDEIDDRTRLVWDASNRLVEIAPPGRPPVRVTRFDASGRPGEIRVGGRTPHVLERDADGDVTVVRHSATVVRHERDGEGRTTAIVDPDGRTARLDRDAAGRIRSITDDLGRTERLVHDTESRVVGRSLLGIDGTTIRSLEFLFDARGRLARTVERGTTAHGSTRDPIVLDHETTDAGARRRRGRSNPETGVGASAEIDLLRRLSTFTDPAGNTTRLEHDLTGRVTALVDARGNRTRFLADDFGRVVLHEAPDTGRVTFVADAAGNRVGERRADGSTVRTVFDAANRPVERVDADGTTRWRYGAAADGGAHGRAVEIGNTIATDRFAYDGEGRLIDHVREIDGHAFSTGYAYDERGRLAGKRLPDGQRLAYHYREDGPGEGTLRAVTRERFWGTMHDTVVGEIDLDARDGRVGWTAGSGVRTEHRFAPTGESVEVRVDGGPVLRYELDATGRVVGLVENGKRSRYGYTAGRLTRASGPDGERRYVYDAVGNRTADLRVGPDGSRTVLHHEYATPGRGNRLLATVDAGSGRRTAYRYDGRGAPVAAGPLRWRRDARGRPLEVRRGDDLVARYAYDAFGGRASKTVYATPDGMPATTYFVHERGALVAEADGAGTIVAQYVYLDDHRPVAKLEGRSLFAIHGDRLGSPRSMTDAAGRTVWEATYTPFGEATVLRADAGLPLRLPGQYLDAETGLHHNHFRDYDPGTGRYLRADPIGLSGGVNGYAYVLADPLNASDPLGLEPTRSQAIDVEGVREIVRTFGREQTGGDESLDLWSMRYLDRQGGAARQVGPFGGSSGGRYVWTTERGWIDLAHLFDVAANVDRRLTDPDGPWYESYWCAALPGARGLLERRLWAETVRIEDGQAATLGEDDGTVWSYEDAPSNLAGLDYVLDYHDPDVPVEESIARFLQDAGATTPEAALNWDTMPDTDAGDGRKFEQNRSFDPVLDPRRVSSADEEKG